MKLAETGVRRDASWRVVEHLLVKNPDFYASYQWLSKPEAELI
jgi:hypothetical protein